MAAPEISQTIQDAMNLVSRLQLRYLCVDSLCIVWEDDENRHSCIKNIASTYASAIAMTVAA